MISRCLIAVAALCASAYSQVDDEGPVRIRFWDADAAVEDTFPVTGEVAFGQEIRCPPLHAFRQVVAYMASEPDSPVTIQCDLYMSLPRDTFLCPSGKNQREACPRYLGSSRRLSLDTSGGVVPATFVFDRAFGGGFYVPMVRVLEGGPARLRRYVGDGIGDGPTWQSDNTYLDGFDFAFEGAFPEQVLPKPSDPAILNRPLRRFGMSFESVSRTPDGAEVRTATGAIVPYDFNLVDYRRWLIGWYANWTAFDQSAEYYPELDYYPLVGGYSPNSAVSLNALEQRLKKSCNKFPDGTVWMIGNEIGFDDRRDPWKYAEAYHNNYTSIKSVNPNWKVATGANGGSILMPYTWERVQRWEGDWPLWKDRAMKEYFDTEFNYIEYLKVCRARHEELYGSPMPVDVYTIHLYDMGQPGSNFVNVETIHAAVRAFRTFLKEIGEERKHVIVKEMGPLTGAIPPTEEQRAAHIVNLNDYLLGLHPEYSIYDREIGCPNDNYRMVNRWEWWTLMQHRKAWQGTGEMIDNVGIVNYMGKTYLEYIYEVAETYDTTAPTVNRVSATRDSDSISARWNASDNGRINDYEVSVGTHPTEADVVHWQSSNTATSLVFANLPLHATQEYFVNVRAWDDGYNHSAIVSAKATESVGSTMKSR